MKDVLLQILPDMNLWKLHSPKEYVVFLLLLLSGAVLFYFWIARLRKARTPAGARKRIIRAVKKAAKQNCCFFIPVCPSLMDNSIWVALEHDVLLLHIFPKGFRIYCSERNERWELFDNSSKESVPNPLPPLEKIAAQLQQHFRNSGITTMQFHAFAVCGDNFAEPEFHLDAETAKQVFSIRTLASWIKKRKAVPLSAKTITTIEEALKRWATPMKGV